MSRNRRLTGLILILLLAAGTAFADANLIAPEDIKADEVKYKTSEAEYGDFIKTSMAGGYEYYPLLTSVRYKGDTAVYGKWLIKRNAEVKAGEPLMEITVPYDEVNETRQELALTRAKEAFEEEKRTRGEAISDLQAQIAVEQDAFARQRLTMELEKARIRLEQYIYQQEYDIRNKTEALAEMRERHSAEYIFAPCDGVVEDMTYMHDGDRIGNGQTVCTIARQEVMLIAVKSSDLRYGMDVSIETGVNKYRQTLTGHVVAASDCLDKVTSEYTLIEIDPFEEDEHFSWKNIKVTGEKIALRNVLVIARRAVVLDGGKYVVTKLRDDGVTQKRYVVQALTTNDLSWIVQGLAEGESVIID